MAKQQPDSPRPNKNRKQDQPEFVADAGVAKADDAGESKKTQLSKKSSQPTQVAKKSPQPTQLASQQPQGPSTPPRPSKMATDDDDVIEAEAAESDVVEAQPASDVIDALPASDVVEAQPASDVAEAAQVEPDEEIVEAAEASDDALGAPRKARAESSVHIKGKKLDLERTERFDGIEQPAEEIEQTAFTDAADDESSAVDLGGKIPKRKAGSRSGIDEVAEALESGVKLDDAAAKVEGRKTDASIDLDDLAGGEKEPSGKVEKSKEAAADSDTLARHQAEEAAAADLVAEEAKAADGSGVDLGQYTKGSAAQDEPVTPLPETKTNLAEQAVEDEEEAAEPKRKPGAAVAARPARAPRQGRRLAAGVLVGILLVIVVLVGLRYVAADLLESVFSALPGTGQPKAARDAKEAQESVKHLRIQLDSARSEKEELEKNLDSKTAEIKKLSAQAGVAAANAKAMEVLRDELSKQKGSLDKLIVAKQQQDALLHDLTKSLVDAKILNANDQLDAAAVAKIAKAVPSDKQDGLAAINKLLDSAMIKESGEKGVQQLLTAKKNADDKLAEINKLLGAEKIKGDGAAGIKEMVTQRKQLQKDRDDLDKAVSDAYRELAAGQLVPATGNPREQLLEGAKAARLRAESPLTVPPAKVVAKVPDAAEVQNAYLGEVHFDKGLRLFWSQQYAQAEEQFRQAAGYYQHDARYQYFLGLSQHAQNTKAKRDLALIAFEKGARLESDSRPSAGEINASLERVQGEPRRLINSYRTKAIELRN